MPEGDTYFAPLDVSAWQEMSRQPLPKGARDDFASTLFVYERRPESHPRSAA
jgi:dihydrofolate reductase